MFCPKCGSILSPIQKKGKKVIGCSCGYVAEKT
ncbi:MAG: transcription elongation factor, partial [Nanoarchaeota archaeon]|nr:transcription elongation factor [Nanoarchaeota archaeon]